MFYYDKPVYLSCIVYLPAFKGYTEEVTKMLEESFSAKQLLYPSDFIPEVIKEMSESGYPKVKSLPLTISCEESLVILSRCLKKFNTFSSVRVTPTPSRLDREITKEKDFVRVVHDLLLQQDSISLSQIWQSNDLPQVVYSNVETPLNTRLARTVLSKMAELEGGKKKANTEIVLETLHKEVFAALNFAKAQEEKSYADSKYQL